MLVFMIIFAIIAVAVFCALTAVSKAYSRDNYPQAASKFKRLRWVISGAIILLILIVFIVSGIHIIDSTEIGVVRTFGQIDHQINAGLNLVNPISDTVTTYDLRVHVREASFASYTKDAQPVTSSIEYQYALDPAYVLDVAKEYGSYDILETKLGNVVEERAKIVFAQYGAMTLIENRSTLSQQVAEEVKEIEELFHINFTSVIVRDIDFSDAFEASVEAKMTAEQDALRAEQEKKTAVVKAEQEAEVAAIQAQKKVVEAQAEADALAITREALQNMPENWITSLWIEKWNGQLPVYSLGDSTGIMINPMAQ